MISSSLAAGRERTRPHRLAQLLAGADRATSRSRDVGHQHDELLAAEARQRVVAAHRGREAVGDLGEHPVADEVPVGVVDALEVVDVGDQQADRGVAPRGAIELGRERLGEVPAVEDAGERIDAAAAIGLVARCCELVRDAPALGDVGDHAVDQHAAVGRAPRAGAIEDPAGLAVGPHDAVLDLDRLAVRHALVRRAERREVVGVHGGLPLVVQSLERDGAPERAEDARARVQGLAEMPLDARDVGVDVLVDRLDDVRQPRARLGERERCLATRRHVDQDPVDRHDAVLGRARVRAVEHHALLAVGAREPVLALERVAGEQSRAPVLHERAVVGMDACAPGVERCARGGGRVDQGLEARRRVDELGLALGVQHVAVDRLVDASDRPVDRDAARSRRRGLGRPPSWGSWTTRTSSVTSRPSRPRTRMRASAVSPRGERREQALERRARPLVRAAARRARGRASPRASRR